MDVCVKMTVINRIKRLPMIFNAFVGACRWHARSGIV